MTSSRQESQPRERRIKEEAREGGRPKASKTWEGKSEPDEQAEPLEAQREHRSRLARREKLSQPSIVKPTVLQRRSVVAPRKAAASMESAK